MSFATIQSGLWEIERHLMQKYGVDAARREMYPLVWYVNTGRASAKWINDLLKCKPYMIARKLHQGGSAYEVISRVKEYVSQKSNPDEDSYAILRMYKDECNQILREVGRGQEYEDRCDKIWKEKYEAEYARRRTMQ